MKASFRVTKPDEVEVKMSLTMTLEQWKLLRVSVASDQFYEPGGKLRQAIDDLVRQASQTFYAAEQEVA